MKLLNSEIKRFFIALGITTGLIYSGILPAAILGLGTSAAIAITFATALAGLEMLRKTSKKVLSFITGLAAGIFVASIFATAPMAALTYAAMTLASLLVLNLLVRHIPTDLFMIVLTASFATGLVLSGGLTSLPLLAPVLDYGMMAAIAATTAGLLGSYAGLKLGFDLSMTMVETIFTGVEDTLLAIINISAYLSKAFKPESTPTSKSKMHNLYERFGSPVNHSTTGENTKLHNIDNQTNENDIAPDSPYQPPAPARQGRRR